MEFESNKFKGYKIPLRPHRVVSRKDANTKTQQALDVCVFAPLSLRDFLALKQAYSFLLLKDGQDIAGRIFEPGNIGALATGRASKDALFVSFYLTIV